MLKRKNPKRVVGGNFRGPVGGPVVADHHVQVRIIQVQQRVQTLAQIALLVVSADHDREGGPVAAQVLQLPMCPQFYYIQGRFGLSMLGGQAEAPFLYRLPCHCPLVGP
jgi:hypothetical protein